MPGARMTPHVGQCLLGGAQDDHLGGAPERHGLPRHSHIGPQPVLAAHGRPETMQRLSQGARLEVAGRELRDDQPGLVEVVGCRALDERQPVARRIDVASGQCRVSRAGERHDRGEALREGVVDLAGQPLALLVHAAVAFGRSELCLRGAQLVDGLRPGLGLGDDAGDEQPQ